MIQKESAMKTLKDQPVKLPSIHNWKTTDEDEIAKRRFRARAESLQVRNLDSRFPIFSNFTVKSGSGLTYSVEIRSVARRRFSCNCVDFRINALGTCKHIEATLLYLEARFNRVFHLAQKSDKGRLDVTPDLTSEKLRIEGLNGAPPRALAGIIDNDGFIRLEDPDEALALLQNARIPSLRISQDLAMRDISAGNVPSSGTPSCNTGKT